MSARVRSLLVECLREPSRLTHLGTLEWEQLLAEAGAARLAGRIVFEADALGVAASAPSWLRDRLDGARNRARENERAIAWEVNRIGRAFDDVGLCWVLLKGAGYVAAGLPPGRGRFVADIDLLVPEARLAQAEAALAAHGWEQKPLDDYDTRYYREWMHELPPMLHRDRHSVVDLHHGILPRTSRLHPDPRVLLDRSLPVGDGAARVLCPTHMVLHGAVHLFHDGEVTGAIRDLVDLDSLCRTFAAGDAAFWTTLLADARELGLERPAYYAVRYATRVLGTPVPSDVLREVEPWGPSFSVRLLMDRLVERALLPDASTSGAAAYALFVRSHWLKMPLRLLVPHLTRKAWTRAGA